MDTLTAAPVDQPRDTGRRANLRRLLSPRHVAVVGGREAETAIRQCLGLGFAGEIWPVNSKRAEMEGRPCFASVAELPAAPDAALVAVPAEATVEVVRELAARGAGGCVCYAAGFAESGAEGAALQARLSAAAGEMALVGPNCYGVLNYLDGVALWPDQHGGQRVERGVAFITQSGNIGLNLTMHERSLPLASVISIGNQACLDFADYIAALAEDERIAAIGLHIEGLRDVTAFAEAARVAQTNGVPLVALTTGHSEAGARAVVSHTGSIAGTEALTDALFDRLGVLRVRSLTALMETLKLLTVVGPLGGRCVMSMSSSGGEASLFADLATKHGFTMPDLSEVQVEALRAVLPDFAAIANPLDYNTTVWGDGAALERCFTTVMDGGCDLAVLVLDMPRKGVPGIEAWHTALDAFIGAQARTGIPAVVASTLSETLPADVRERMIAQGIAPLQGLDDAVTALDAAALWGEIRDRGAPTTSTRTLIPPAGRPATVRTLDEGDSKRRLAAFGLTVPESRVVAAADVPDVAAEIGFPVVIKAVSGDLPHKSESGAVGLDVQSRKDAAAAVEQIRAALAGVAVSADRFLVEPMVRDAVVEVIVGVTADPRFGLALVLGSGGVLAELVGDTCTVLLPADRGAVEAVLDSLKVARLIDGYRGRPAGDRAALLDAIEAVAAFAEANCDRLVELDVNPLLVLPDGQGAVAVDALIRLTDD